MTLLASLPLWFRRDPVPMDVLPLTSDHAERLAAIHASAFARPWSDLDFERLLVERGVVADGLFPSRAAEPAGFALSRRVVDEAEILTVAIVPEARGQGHGRPLLARHLDHLACVGVRVVHLEVEENNAPALALYRALNFAEIGRRVGYYAKADGTRVAALTMSARL